MDRERPLEAMIEAVRAAVRAIGRIAVPGGDGCLAQKPDRSPVTAGDLAAQAIIAARMRDALPGLPLVAEETSAPLRDPASPGLLRTVLDLVRSEWPAAGAADVAEAIDLGRGEAGRGDFLTLDPIDGTKGFLRGEHFSVALALVAAGRVVLAVLGCPTLDGGIILSAARGGGAFAAPAAGEGSRRLSVTAIADLRAARLVESVEREHGSPGRLARIATRLGIRQDVERADSQAKYGFIALGRAEVYLRLPSPRPREHLIWDHAAGSLIVEEAGGRVTDLDGHPLDFGRGRTLAGVPGLVATNGPIHDAVLEAVRLEMKKLS